MRSYTAKDMKSIKNDRDKVRLRPTTYIPDKGIEGVLHVIFEIIDNSIDEALNVKDANKIEINIHDDTKMVSVKDIGRGIPHEALLDALTTLNTSSKFSNDENTAYRTSGGTNGIGLKLAVFLSTKFKIETTSHGKCSIVIFENGILKEQKDEKRKGHGTEISFILDKKLLETEELKYELVYDLLKRKAHIFPEVEFVLNKFEKDVVTKTKKFVGKGIEDAVKKHNPDLPIIYAKKEIAVEGVDPSLDKIKKEKILVEFALSMKEDLIEVKDTEEYNSSFVNSIDTVKGGTHVDGLKEGIQKFFKQFFNEKHGVKPQDMIIAMTSFVVVNMSSPEFRGQYKDKLNNSSAKTAVRDVVYDVLSKEKDSVIKKYVAFIKEVARSREASKKVRVKKKITSFDKEMIDKYSPILESANTYVRELYAVEGDSVIGTVLQARDINIHAVFPLRRPLNVIDRAVYELEKSSTASSFNDLMSIIGVPLGKSFRKEDLNFDKIIFAQDADVDGDGMTAAYLALMVKFVPQLFRWGMVYRLVPPLYKFSNKKKKVYLASQKELNKYIIDGYVSENKLKYHGSKFSKKDIGKLLEDNFFYAKEVDKVVKDLGAPASILEALIWYINPNTEYKKADVEMLKTALQKKFKFIDVKLDKQLIVEGEEKGEYFYITINKYFFRTIEKIKEIQKMNMVIYGYELNGEKESLYSIMKSLESYLPKNIDRIKGLGELDPPEFKEECMNSENRHLLRMEISKEGISEDLEQAMIHFSKKDKYKKLRAELMANIEIDETLLDT